MSASAGESGAGASVQVGGVNASGGLSSNVLQVLDANGTAAELLHRLTIAQLAELLHSSVAQLLAEVQALPGYGLLGPLLGRLAENPGTTVQELIDALAGQAPGAAPVEQLIERLLGAGSDTAEQLHSLFSTVLGDLARDGQLSALESELGVPGGAMEVARLVPGSLGAVAGTLGTTSERLGKLLQASGAVSQLPSAASPIVTAPLEGASSGVATLIGSPNGSGGLTITNVISVPAPAQAAAGGSQPATTGVTDAFKIVSIKVTRRGAIIETVSVPGPGRVAISATTAVKVRVRRSSHARAKVVTRRAAVAVLATEVAGGLRTLTLHPKLHPKRVGSARRTTVSLVTTYTPRGGRPSTIRRSVTITRAAGRRKHRA